MSVSEIQIDFAGILESLRSTQQQSSSNKLAIDICDNDRIFASLKAQVVGTERDMILIQNEVFFANIDTFVNRLILKSNGLIKSVKEISPTQVHKSDKIEVTWRWPRERPL